MPPAAEGRQSTVSDREEGLISESDNVTRTIAVFFGAITVSLLSFTHDAYSNRGTPPAYQHKIADDVVDALLLVSLISSMSVAALRHPRNIRLTTRLLNLAFISCLIGVMIFTWTSLKRGVAISLTVFVALLGLAFSRSNDLARGDDTDTLQTGGFKKFLEVLRH